jgi:hypothetical protein
MGPTGAQLFIDSVNTAFASSLATNRGGGVSGGGSDVSHPTCAFDHLDYSAVGEGAHVDNESEAILAAPDQAKFGEDRDEQGMNDAYDEEGKDDDQDEGNHVNDDDNNDGDNGDDDDDCEEEKEEEGCSPGFVSTFEVDLPKAAVTITEHALILKLPGLTQRKMDSLTVIRGGGQEWVRVSVLVNKKCGHGGPLKGCGYRGRGLPCPLGGEGIGRLSLDGGSQVSGCGCPCSVSGRKRAESSAVSPNP